jgi:hypothetical protein
MTHSIVGGIPAGIPSDGPEMCHVIDWAHELWDAVGVARLTMEKA